jgi:hypothetical protein
MHRRGFSERVYSIPRKKIAMTRFMHLDAGADGPGAREAGSTVYKISTWLIPSGSLHGRNFNGSFTTNAEQTIDLTTFNIVIYDKYFFCNKLFHILG